MAISEENETSGNLHTAKSQIGSSSVQSVFRAFAFCQDQFLDKVPFLNNKNSIKIVAPAKVYQS